MSTILTTENLSLFYGKKEALKGINIDFDDKGITALIGPSGCGNPPFYVAWTGWTIWFLM